MKHIIVLGAGVTGLTTALLLKQKGYEQVTVVAKHIPGDMNIEYTSPYAGAHWRTMAKNNDKLLQTFDATSYHKFLALAKKDTGVIIVPSYDYYDDDSLPEIYDPWFKDTVLDFKLLQEKDGLPQGAKIGHTYTTGLGARFLGGVQDKNVFPTRGQTVIVRASHIKETMTHIGVHGITYIIPRSDGTVVLGGTSNKDDFNPFVDDQTTEKIIKRTTQLCPKLVAEKPLEIIRCAVGLRPTRINGPRFENETIFKGQKKIQVTHAYGHGGFGYQSSWGSAEYVIQLMEQGFKEKNSSHL
ncbi:uncharacterized protein B0P05DRAFT_578524 [Gilbertella persicaria]|uniref:uncharacterized protein n=1 Tax=Gilbertella persicaria TaxID=101096 RepID=UPI00221E42F2|nr:uncharacterized protein B0P05DRAFT_578524 [Gilbertella persicaria]KAI8084072.1 hypothetical protein B0P05DRAFT_578524 [Gilbertella persicaria]